MGFRDVDGDWSLDMRMRYSIVFETTGYLVQVPKEAGVDEAGRQVVLLRLDQAKRIDGQSDCGPVSEQDRAYIAGFFADMLEQRLERFVVRA